MKSFKIEEIAASYKERLGDFEYTVTELCELPNISRSSVYYMQKEAGRKIEIMNGHRRNLHGNPDIRPAQNTGRSVKGIRDLCGRERSASKPSIRIPSRYS